MVNPIRQQVREAFSKIVGDLRKLGFDPYVDVDKDYVAVVLPTAQLAEMIHRNADTPGVRKYINLEVKEATAGNKSFIVIKAMPKTQNRT